jgi:TetR/AcrR family macrolide resistance operon transcriptional repressor
MARPFTATDDDILRAAAKVMQRRGPDAFALAEVATEVGLSRAAIILRFKSTHDLKVTLLTKMVQRFADALATLPQSPSGDNVLRVAAFIGTHVGSREGSGKFFANYFTTNVRDRELFELERRRGAVLRDAISKVMPQTAIDHDSAILAFRAHLSGTIMAWLGNEEADSCRYVVLRTREWLRLAGIAYSEELVEELSAAKAGRGSKRGRSA